MMRTTREWQALWLAGCTTRKWKFDSDGDEGYSL